MKKSRCIAIVGMACRFPGAPDLETFWHNLESGCDTVTDVPEGRWEPVFYDPHSDSLDRVYCKRGGFLGQQVSFDAPTFGVMPVAARGAEPDQLLALQVAAEALADAGYQDRSLPRERTSVILGRGGYMTAGVARLEQHVRTVEQLAQCLKALLPDLSEEELHRIKAEFQGELSHLGPDTVIGLVPNLAASRIANRLDLHGSAYTVDAACASSLVAVDQACRELLDGRADLVLAGGVHLCHHISFWSGFCQLGAVSRSQQIRPFDRRADGLLIGEGLGILALKRRADAERDGDRIYAILRGTGVASDGRDVSLMTPRVEGQILALERAWKAAGLDPQTIGLLEAHGTGTPAGDAAELLTLQRFFGGPASGAPRAGLGSVKSMIGHAMPAAGAAGLIKAALAVYHGVLPPTLHCEEPHEGVAQTRFRLITRAEPWEENGLPRCAAVNAFGFGGIDAHVVLEATSARRRSSRMAARASGNASSLSAIVPPRWAAADTETSRLEMAGEDAEELLVLAADTPQSLIRALDEGCGERGKGLCRLALLNPTEERRTRARAVMARGRPWRGREHIWFSPRGLLTEGGKTVFLFPGLEAAFEPRVGDVAGHFGLPLPTCLAPRDIFEHGIGVVGVGRLLRRALEELGVLPDAVAGHSVGEWSGMIASGVTPEDAVNPFIESLMPETIQVPDVVFAAAGCGAADAEAAIQGLPEIGVSHDNCPHQAILCGRAASVKTAFARFAEKGVLCQKLPFKSGFHSPLFAGYLAPHRENLRKLPLTSPSIPLWSATTCRPYPKDPEAIRELALEHLVRPVRFRELTEVLYREGFRVFVEVGSGTSLAGFVEDTLRGLPHLAMSANVRIRSGLAQLRRLACALYVEGAPVVLRGLAAAPKPSADRSVTLPLGVPLVKLATPLDRPSAIADPVRADPDHPVWAEFAASLREVEAAQREVLKAWEQGSLQEAPPPAAASRWFPPREVTQRLAFSVETFPDLRDHCFFSQPPDWPSLSDRYPVMPLTASIALMMRTAAELVPELFPIGVEGIQASHWLAVEPPVEATVTARFDGDSRVEVAIEGYTQATVLLAEAYPEAPAPDATPLEDERPAPITAAGLYRDRWMFHGPRYQGVVSLGPIGRNGIRGTLRSLPAEGALLDNAGQLFGYWVMVMTEVDRLAMPVKVDRMTFFGPHPPPGQEVQCTARIRHMDTIGVRTDMELCVKGRLWAKIEGWEDRRFESNARVWAVRLFPELNLLGQRRAGGYLVVTDVWRTGAARDLLARRYLGEAERAEYASCSPRLQGQWLNGRIAVKDAVRDFLWHRGYGPLFPVQITVEQEAGGRPVVRGPFREDLRVSVAHKEGMAVALAAEGRDVGIDLERISARPAGFAELALTGSERALVAGASQDEWLTRVWVAKEAVAKARGAGLRGDPRRFEATRIDRERLLVDSMWVETRIDGEFMVGWTAT